MSTAKAAAGSIWEDRYHATAIDTDEHLHRCLVYIDLNMVRTGLVDHPVKWEHSGYHEIQQPPKRYAVIDLPGLVALCGFSKLADFQRAHCQWIEAALQGDLAVRDIWPDGEQRDLTFIYSACGCPVHVLVKRVGDRTVRVKDTPVIFPDDPKAVELISRLMRW